jgi:tetratricopeptide (TPR) repeat protein
MQKSKVKNLFLPQRPQRTNKNIEFRTRNFELRNSTLGVRYSFLALWTLWLFPSAGLTKDKQLAAEQQTATLKKEEMELAQALIRQFPQSEDPIVLMGNVQWRHGNAAEALKFWQEALQINPRRPDVYKAMGWFAMGKENYEEAIINWRKALQADPQMPGVHNSIARALMGLGRHAEAIEELRKDIKISPHSSSSYFLLGQGYSQQKEYEKAKANYEKAISFEPDLTNAYYGLFTACARLNQHEKAQEYLAVFKKLKAEDMKVLKDRNDAYNDLIDMRQGAAETYMFAAKMYQGRGDTQKCEQLLKRAAALDPNNTVYLMELASLYGTSSRFSDALAMHKKISELEPNNPVCHLNIGGFSARLKQFADAETAFTKAIALVPENSAGYRSLAQLYLETGTKLPQARDLVQKAVALEPIAANYFVLSWACDRNADTDSALSAIKKALELDPDNPRYQQMYELIRKRSSKQ